MAVEVAVWLFVNVLVMTGTGAVLVTVVMPVRAVTAKLHAAERRLGAHVAIEGGTGMVPDASLLVTVTTVVMSIAVVEVLTIVMVALVVAYAVEVAGVIVVPWV